jgi:hypothetical protein
MAHENQFASTVLFNSGNCPLDDRRKEKISLNIQVKRVYINE